VVHMESVIGLDDDKDVEEDVPPPQVTEYHVAEILSKWSSIPIGKWGDGLPEEHGRRAYGSCQRTIADDDKDVEEDAPPPQVTEYHVAEILSKWSSIPIGKLESGEMDCLRNMEDELTARVKGQSRAVRSFACSVRRSRSGLRDPLLAFYSVA